jgi:diguanylate cyclase (GGDEF)-like protein
MNPNNKPSPFEKRALEYVERANKKEYYELGDDSNFRYLGALVTTQACLQCHAHQGYKLGDIRGGISITLDSSKYEKVAASIKNNAIIVKIFVLLFLLSIVFLVRKQLENNEELKTEVQKRTQEINSTRHLLQKILDSDTSFLLLSKDREITFTNKPLLDFFNFKTLEEFKKHYSHISDIFETVDNDDFLQHFVNGEHWIEYLHREQGHKELKVLIKKDDQNRYFKPHSEEIIVDNEKVYLIIFDDITKEFEKMTELEEKASTDSLTKLFNRGKFNDILAKEIDLRNDTLSALSLLFIDIDHFKAVNDAFGHDVGDEVLVELANILKSSTRTSDTISRWGGEEFAITLQSTNSSQASEIAQKIRAKVENYTFKSAGKLTISVGVTEYKDKEDRDKFIKRVDEALYEAKESGRNKIVIR